jgi:spermidine synthase
LSKTVTDASVHFRKWNNNALSDRRVTLIHDDGRNYLLRTTNRYDIITTDPIDVDDAGTAGLYSREYYELVRSRLAPDGIACQWLMTRLSPDDFKTAVRTFLAVFPNCSVWNAKQSVVLVGMTAEKSITIGEYNAKCLQPGVREDLASVGIFSPDDLRAKVFAGPQQAADLVGDGVLITDNHPIVEYSRPRLDRLVLGGGNTNRPADPP